jgi:hypothetical protein
MVAYISIESGFEIPTVFEGTWSTHCPFIPTITIVHTPSAKPATAFMTQLGVNNEKVEIKATSVLLHMGTY